MYKYQEKRKYKRIKRYERSEKPYMTRFKIRSDKAQEMEAYDWNSISLMNISAGGVAFFIIKI